MWVDERQVNSGVDNMQGWTATLGGSHFHLNKNRLKTISSTVITRKYLKSFAINQQFFQFNNLFPESFRERVNIECRCDESNLMHQTSETYSTPEEK